jgi:hypothetical protein
MEQEQRSNELDALLAMRRFEPAFPALAERIINAARYSRGRNISLGEWLSGIFADLRLPQPAYALAAMLMLGIGIGVSGNDSVRDDSILIATISDEGSML